MLRGLESPQLARPEFTGGFGVGVLRQVGEVVTGIGAEPLDPRESSDLELFGIRFRRADSGDNARAQHLFRGAVGRLLLALDPGNVFRGGECMGLPARDTAKDAKIRLDVPPLHLLST